MSGNDAAATDLPRGAAWRALGQKVRGAHHERAGAPMQDDIAIWQDIERGLPLIVAVSDGVGSARCFRSADGAALAVATALRVLHDFANELATSDLPAIKRAAEHQLPRSLVHSWQQAVEGHIHQHPFDGDGEDSSVTEPQALVKPDGDYDRLLAYGATLLAVLVTRSYIVYLQLGDGDIVTVSAHGDVTRPLPKDERLFANETTALCSPRAWNQFRFQLQPLVALMPALILLSTDGYANSFRDDAAYLQVGKDILDSARQHGLESVEENLAMWLRETTDMGSGDDITLGIICRLDALTRIAEDRGAKPVGVQDWPYGRPAEE